jgi:PAS domain S-box-containing protein
MESVVALLQEMVGCRCIGIRIRNERGEIPYEASAGFSEEFLESESRLQIGRDECVCTRVIVGRPLPCDASAMTPAGSFVCNDTRKFLRGLTEKQKSCFRAVCAKNGYASVAVVPVRYQETMLGAIHIADERPGLFPRDIVEFVETISPLIGEAAHRFHVEKERRHNEERYRSLVTATTQIVWTTDAEGRVVDDLPAWRSFTGQSVEDLRNWGWINALHPDDRERTSAIWSAAVKARSLYETEYRVRRADGEYRDFAVRGVPVIEPDGAIREWVGTCTDVTERKRADEQLQVLNEALSQRATQLRALATELTLAEQQERKRLAQVLHDGLQQLLVGMKFSVAAIRSKVKADAGLVKRLEGLDAVVAESIQLSRSLAVELNPPMLSESGLVAAVKWLAEEMKRVHGLTVRVIAGSEVPADAEGVAVLMFQAVRELLFNIVKHAKVKSATVQVSPLTGNQVQVDVVDKGKGFAAASGRKQDVPTGLGLFGIQERIAHMGGRMEVHSAPGQGTRVTLLAEIRPPEATACR